VKSLVKVTFRICPAARPLGRMSCPLNSYVGAGLLMRSL
jgi:hypothetical protein